MTYDTVVAGLPSLQQPSRPHKPAAKGSDPSAPAASPEAAIGRMSFVYVSLPLCDMPDGTTQSAKVANNSADPAVEKQNKTPIYVSGVTDMRGFLTWLRASCQSGLSAQIKWENIMLSHEPLKGSEPQ